MVESKYPPLHGYWAHRKIPYEGVFGQLLLLLNLAPQLCILLLHGLQCAFGQLMLRVGHLKETQGLFLIVGLLSSPLASSILVDSIAIFESVVSHCNCSSIALFSAIQHIAWVISKSSVSNSKCCWKDRHKDRSPIFIQRNEAHYVPLGVGHKLRRAQFIVLKNLHNKGVQREFDFSCQVFPIKTQPLFFSSIRPSKGPRLLHPNTLWNTILLVKFQERLRIHRRGYFTYLVGTTDALNVKDGTISASAASIPLGIKLASLASDGTSDSIEAQVLSSTMLEDWTKRSLGFHIFFS